LQNSKYRDNKFENETSPATFETETHKNIPDESRNAIAADYITQLAMKARFCGTVIVKN